MNRCPPLDVTVSSQILRLLLDIHKKRGLTILFISHDLNIVRHFCHRVAVIYLGQIVEMADVKEIYENPRHPYTQLLFDSVLSDSVNGYAAKEYAETDDTLEPDGSETSEGVGCSLLFPMSQKMFPMPAGPVEGYMLEGGQEHFVRCIHM